MDPETSRAFCVGVETEREEEYKFEGKEVKLVEEPVRFLCVFS